MCGLAPPLDGHLLEQPAQECRNQAACGTAMHRQTVEGRQAGDVGLGLFRLD